MLTVDQYRVGRKIRAPEVRVIGSDNTQLGILKLQDALKLAEDQNLDLVEVGSKSNPPTCKVIDYGKWKFDQAKKDKREHRNPRIETKEIKFRPKTDDHDFDFKLKHIREFLEDGNKVRLTVALKGREIAHPEIGRAMLDKAILACSDIARIDQIPLFEGKNISAVISKKIFKTT